MHRIPISKETGQARQTRFMEHIGYAIYSAQMDFQLPQTIAAILSYMRCQSANETSA